MTLRAVVQDGLIVINTHGAIADGTTVEVSIPKTKRSNGATGGDRSKSRKKRSSKKARVPGYGMWANWKELGTSEEAVDRLRALTRRKRVG